jgi:hypothetical protein
MIKNFVFVIVLTTISFAAFSQEKTNPIVFLDLNIGYVWGGSSGFINGTSLNYQVKDNLFTIRTTQLIDSNLDVLSPYLPLPVFEVKETLMEYGLLYGKRYVYDNKSLSFSAGIALVERQLCSNVEGVSSDFLEKTNSIGFPFEVNIKWFKSDKEKYRIYGIVPVGKATSFGNSFGFKLIGNISKTSYVGIELSFGLGFHKAY